MKEEKETVVQEETQTQFREQIFTIWGNRTHINSYRFTNLALEPTPMSKKNLGLFDCSIQNSLEKQRTDIQA